MSLRISQVIDFLEKAKEKDGDIDIQTITGFWVQTIPSTGKRIVVCAIGDGKSVEDALRGR